MYGTKLNDENKQKTNSDLHIWYIFTSNSLEDANKLFFVHYQILYFWC